MKGGIAIILHSLIENSSEIVGVFYTAEESSYEDNGLNIIMPELLSCLLYTSPSPRDLSTSRMPSSA